MSTTSGRDSAGMSEALKKAFDFSQDSAKQLIALSTGVLALTITFFKDFAGGGSSISRTIIAIAWLFYLAAIIAGAAHLYALTAELDPSPNVSTGPSIYSGTARVTAGIQQIAFILALILTAVAGAVALASGGTSASSRSAAPSAVQATAEALRGRLETAETEIAHLRHDNAMLRQQFVRRSKRARDQDPPVEGKDWDIPDIQIRLCGRQVIFLCKSSMALGGG